MSKPIYILNGPNLNLLGTREPELYGAQSLADISELCSAKAATFGLIVDFRQTNDEGELVNQVHEAQTKACAIIINAAAYTHTSIALHDALRMVDVPIIEVHLSNIYKREEFRHKNFVSPVANGAIYGFGANGYELAIEAARKLI